MWEVVGISVLFRFFGELFGKKEGLKWFIHYLGVELSEEIDYFLIALVELSFIGFYHNGDHFL
jgi:hypothetical protein